MRILSIGATLMLLAGCFATLSDYKAMCNGQVTAFTKAGEYNKVECK